jgi:hypothetical protein
MEEGQHQTVVVPNYGGVHSGDRVRHSDPVGTAHSVEAQRLHRAGLRGERGSAVADALNRLVATA